uniref:DNA-directed RNA polymerase III subunit RPC9 n=1 Tax=Laticauda laticaudata TaxID=8630 RepID=A0A8C5T0H1_LATLA
MGNYLNKGEDIFFQVYKLLTDLKQQCKEPGKSKQSVGQQNLKTITYETLKYISKTPCKFQSPEIVRDFLIALKNQKLTNNNLLSEYLKENYTQKYTAQKKGTLKQHNVTPSQSHFYEIKLST